jgi:PucR C-terminal helix-turn-helix domain
MAQGPASYSRVMSVAVAGEVVRRIIERADLDEFADRVLDSFWERPEFQDVHPPRERVRAWVRWNLDLVVRWLVEQRPPSEHELEAFRDHARARAADGVPPDIVPANFRRGARFAWGALLEAATEEERPALLESADLLFEYVDRVSRIYSAVYEEAARARVAGTEEVAARALLARISAEEAPLPEDHQLAEQLGFPLERAARPFVIASPGGPARHAALAASLRRRGGVLAVSEGRRVAGLARIRSPWSAANLEDEAVVAQGVPAIRVERGRALDELRLAVEVAVGRGVSGEIALEDYLPELLLRRSPQLAARIRKRVYGPLSEELAHTLDVLVEHSFERGSTATALPVHRNTLRDRIARMSEATGLDLECAEGRGLAWLAWRSRRDRDGAEGE